MHTRLRPFKERRAPPAPTLTLRSICVLPRGGPGALLANTELKTQELFSRTKRRRTEENCHERRYAWKWKPLEGRISQRGIQQFCRVVGILIVAKLFFDLVLSKICIYSIHRRPI